MGRHRNLEECDKRIQQHLVPRKPRVVAFHHDDLAMLELSFSRIHFSV